MWRWCCGYGGKPINMNNTLGSEGSGFRYHSRQGLWTVCIHYMYKRGDNFTLNRYISLVPSYAHLMKKSKRNIELIEYTISITWSLVFMFLISFRYIDVKEVFFSNWRGRIGTEMNRLYTCKMYMHIDTWILDRQQTITAICTFSFRNCLDHVIATVDDFNLEWEKCRARVWMIDRECKVFLEQQWF